MTFNDLIYVFLKELRQFDCNVSCADLIWGLVFPDRRDRWYHVQIVKYKETFYISHIDGKSCSLEAVPDKTVKTGQSFGFSSYEDGHDDPARAWMPLITSARAWLKTVKKDWIRSNQRVQKHYPLSCRYGIVPNAVVRASLSDLYRIDKELGKNQTKKFIRLVEEGYFFKESNTITKSMTANDFFNYCRIAYIAGKRKDEQVDKKMTGRQMYERYADGRHEGLLDIEGDSKEAFADWIDGKHPKRTRGGHPWEIKRGGNTTHINLSVSRPPYSGNKDEFKIELCGAAITRLKETIQMFLAIYDASLPIAISDPEGIRQRLLAQDNIGIVPSYSSLHRANQRFRDDQSVYDVLYYNDLGRHKRRIAPFITWELLPVFKPSDL